MMQTIPYNLQQGKWKSLDNYQEQEQEQLQEFSFNNNIGNKVCKGNKNISRTTSSVESEPTSTLDTTRQSPSPSPSSGGGGIGLEEWDSLFPNGDGSLLPWIIGDPDSEPQQPNHCKPVFDNFIGEGLIPPASMQSQYPVENRYRTLNEKPQILNSQFVLNQQQAHTIANPSFVMSPSVRQVSGDLNPNVVHDPGEWEEQGVKEQLYKAADMIQTGNFVLAQEILARLNHRLILPAKPSLRAALYVKEALLMLLQLSNPVAAPPPKTFTPYDVVHKMDAYKLFSQVSPVTQFVNFTLTQAVLEALDDSQAVHVFDFDIGCGAQWAPLIQELPLRKRGVSSLRITAVAPLSTHPFELTLVRENLVQFANDAGVGFELQVVSLDSFDQSSFPNLETSKDECVVVSIPTCSCSTRPSLLPSILMFTKQLFPKIVVSFDRGFDRFDTPFPQHLIHSLESVTNLLESLEGVNAASNIVTKIEKFFVQPRIENTVLGRVHAPGKMAHWKSLFASAGLIPLQFSNFTETQADYVVKRSPGQGFHVDKRQASLVLSWQRRELVVASAWR
ncbi:scarecrow-like protein 6 [Silene latifolia]|uniref:scarecrow-like protein 6 n=1 Tax=Silene latifolia TaxID=37657 RepID=UPI003D76B4A6